MLAHDFIFSIHPRFAEKIASREKTIELRRRFRKQVPIDSRLFVYATTPIRCIIGYGQIASVHVLPLQQLWLRFGKAACITRNEFFEYFSGCQTGFAIEIAEFEEYEDHVSTELLHEELGKFCVPQSYRFITERERDFIEYDWTVDTSGHQRLNCA